MSFEIDRDNLLTYFGYAVKSYTKFKERGTLREKLARQLRELRELKPDAEFRKKLAELEERIANVIDKERQILTRQKKETGLQNRLKNRMAELEKKLTYFIEFHKQKRPEIKIGNKTKERQMLVLALKKQIAATLLMCAKLKKSKNYPAKELAKIEGRLAALKEKLKKIPGL